MSTLGLEASHNIGSGQANSLKRDAIAPIFNTEQHTSKSSNDCQAFPPRRPSCTTSSTSTSDTAMSPGLSQTVHKICRIDSSPPSDQNQTDIVDTCDTVSQAFSGRLSRLKEQVLPLRPFRKHKPRWPDPEASIDQFCGMSGRFSYWEAKGPAKQAFKELSDHIIRILEDAEIVVPAPYLLMFDCFMMGKVRKSAMPRVMFSCRHVPSRVNATQLLRKSKILERYAGFDVGHWSWPPHEGPPQVTGSDADSTSNITAGLQLFSEPIFTTMGTRRLLPALRVCSNIRSWESCLLATIGCSLYLSGTATLVTVAHALNSALAAVDNGWNDNSQEDDSLVDFGDLEDEDSQSLCQDDTQDNFSGQGSLNVEPSSTNGSPLDISSVGNSELEDRREEAKGEMKRVNARSGKANESPDHSNKNLGTPDAEQQTTLSIVYISERFDYALLKRKHDTNTQLRPDIPILNWNNVASDATEDSPMLVRALTSSAEYRSGIIAGRYIHTLLPSCTKFVRAYTVEFDGELVKGDSGAVVLDVESKKIVGLTVATVPGSMVAYIMPAKYILEDLASMDISILGCESPSLSSDSHKVNDTTSIDDSVRARTLTCSLSDEDVTPDDEFGPVADSTKVVTPATPVTSAQMNTVRDIDLGLSNDEVNILRQAQAQAYGRSGPSRAASQASSQGLLLLDSGSLAQLGRHFDRVLQHIQERLDYLSEQSQIVTMQVYLPNGDIANNVDAEIAQYHGIIQQIDELELDYDRIRHIRAIIRGLAENVQALEPGLAVRADQSMFGNQHSASNSSRSSNDIRSIATGSRRRMARSGTSHR